MMDLPPLPQERRERKKTSIWLEMQTFVGIVPFDFAIDDRSPGTALVPEQKEAPQRSSADL
jgi:hypothetical protein